MDKEKMIKPVDKNEWPPLSTIIKAVKTYGDTKSTTSLNISADINKQEDSINFKIINNHCFVILYMQNKNTCIITDSDNLCINDCFYRKKLLSNLNGIVKCIPFNGTKRSKDYYASSASGIGIEFQRMVRLGKIPDEIKVSRSTLERLIPILHKKKIKFIKSNIIPKNTNWKVSCKNCGKKFNTRNRGVLNLHKC